jgi:hypothetical protein
MLCTGRGAGQTALTAYADANGNLDGQKLTCAQLAGAFQGDASFTWARHGFRCR